MSARKRFSKSPQDILVSRCLTRSSAAPRWKALYAPDEKWVPETSCLLHAWIIGKNCSIDLLIDDIRNELRGRPMPTPFA
ncbi:MAG: hypothetical protein EOS04_32000 [Mesorhizobium sp.]|nr:MAG: hypothetical protein EOR98_32440 [Mesorhizobium sp.]RWN70705.1 MAG: hypothetical protein EOS02_33190 [Mesorhizobium sp.]RWN71333.1 MAG: hypothetical protein EOS01_31420 [Mesorhizobium sp.]RWN82280.1 MAG: hypothetical protein EOS04_32000 [Mesorhizobium sp.]RWO06728.1 MAG: hypothetical protein EOS15_32570 [Mesorhizobium sp.]